jgi:hypothetical protein
LQDEAMIEFLAYFAGALLHQAEVHNPRIGGEIPLDLEKDVVVVTVERLAVAAGSGEVRGSEPESISFQGDPEGHAG